MGSAYIDGRVICAWLGARKVCGRKVGSRGLKVGGRSELVIAFLNIFIDNKIKP